MTNPIDGDEVQRCWDESRSHDRTSGAPAGQRPRGRDRRPPGPPRGAAASKGVPPRPRGAVPETLKGEERLAALRELFGIKLVGGFIALDQHVGCVACRFCLSRRHALWREVYARGLQLDGAFESPEEARALLERSLAFTRARVPLRFGHNTDARLQWEFGRRLFGLLPEDQPFIFMTRFPLQRGDEALFRGQPNLLLKMTITPPSASLAIRTPVEAILRSVARVPMSNVFFLVGPLVADNLRGARDVLERLPEGAWCDVKPLTTAGLPLLRESVPAPEDALEELREVAARRGLVMTDYFGCLFRRRLSRRFYKVDEAPGYMRRACAACEQHALCWTEGDPATLERQVRREAALLDLELGAAAWEGAHTLRFECRTPAGRGDETYLSERVGTRVLLSSVPDGSQGGSFCFEEDAMLRRWQRVGLLPVDELEAGAERLLRRIETRLGAGAGA